MNLGDKVNPPIQGQVYAVLVAAAGSGAIDLTTDFPFTPNALNTSVNARVTFWENRFVSVRAVGGDLTVAISDVNTPALDPTAVGNSQRVGVTIPDGQQLDFWVGKQRYLQYASTAGARMEVWPTSDHAL